LSGLLTELVRDWRVASVVHEDQFRVWWKADFAEVQQLAANHFVGIQNGDYY